ncbi:MAG TPA: UDP-N-acetylmuramoyl-L-alanine--D-glutamate ligase [Candidatus Saccharimonadales bacterium]|nr:UDP-N-acetylmuramoyl-L-alanine--D-glutamate ligase [Candidatus Saccharimonadales bacterium]
MKVAIAGYGIEGKSNYTYFLNQGHEVVIVDEHEVKDAPVDASVIWGENAFSRLKGFDMVVRTAGLAPRKIVTDGKIWSATNEFLAKCPAPIIGVTGSKGKGTTCSLIASILRAGGHTVHLVGNIGVPALDILPTIQTGDIVVYEMSSFQLWDAEKSPQVAVVLMIEPDHLDVHKNFDEYVGAKANIATHQRVIDLVVYKAQNSLSSSIASASAGDKVGFPWVQTAHVSDDAFWYGDTRLCDVNALKLPGVHNLDNACAAIDAAWRWVKDGDVIAKGLSAFTGLPHRLKFVQEIEGVKYYDDSIATTPGSAIAAMYAFSQPKILILGGSSKGANFSEVARTAQEVGIKLAILIGEEAKKLQPLFENVRVPFVNLGTEVSMEEVVDTAYKKAVPGDVVVLSPACASFGMFKNYADRGEQFIAAVNALNPSEVIQ